MPADDRRTWGREVSSILSERDSPVCPGPSTRRLREPPAADDAERSPCPGIVERAVGTDLSRGGEPALSIPLSARAWARAVSPSPGGAPPAATAAPGAGLEANAARDGPDSLVSALARPRMPWVSRNRGPGASRERRSVRVPPEWVASPRGSFPCTRSPVRRTGSSGLRTRRTASRRPGAPANPAASRG